MFQIRSFQKTHPSVFIRSIMSCHVRQHVDLLRPNHSMPHQQTPTFLDHSEGAMSDRALLLNLPRHMTALSCVVQKWQSRTTTENEKQQTLVNSYDISLFVLLFPVLLIWLWPPTDSVISCCRTGPFYCMYVCHEPWNYARNRYS